MFIAILLLFVLSVTAATQECYINQCGCPSNPTAPAWCNWNTNARITSPWCNEKASNCEGNCSGRFCPTGTATPSATPSAKPTATPSAKPSAKPSALPTAVPSAAPTDNKCYINQCGCPGSDTTAPTWCNWAPGANAEITSPWCNEKAEHCEGNCNGKFCEPQVLGSPGQCVCCGKSGCVCC